MTFLTIAQGDALGISPGMPGPNGVIPTLKAIKVLPPSSNGCNQIVCIDIIGVGLFVAEWDTKAYFTSGQDTFAAYWQNNTVIATSSVGYAPPGEWEYSYWPTDQYFANNTKLCNTWIGAPGKPCETIHS